MMKHTLLVALFLTCCSLGFTNSLQKRFIVDTNFMEKYALHECVLCKCDHKCLFGSNDGTLCKDVNNIHCDSHGCGQNQCSGHGTCYRLGSEDSKCLCNAGYTGPYCEQDHCSSNPCVHGRCSSTALSYTCSCNKGWFGKNCDTDVQPTTTTASHCASNPCVHGYCTSHRHGSQCACSAGWMGTHCDIKHQPMTTAVPYCSSNPCVHGRCTSDANGYQCACASGWSGKNCEIDNNECSSNPCKNNGRCLDFEGFFACVCADGWSGPTCEKDSIPSCSHLCTVEPVGTGHSVFNYLAEKCTHSSKGSNEAMPISCCGLGQQDTWVKGIDVMGHCYGTSHLQAYTPIASFLSGRMVPGTSGVFIKCYGDGFKYIRQTCNESPEIITVGGNSTQDPNTFHVIY